MILDIEENNFGNQFIENSINVTNYINLIGKLSLIEVGPIENIGKNILISAGTDSNVNSSLKNCNSGFKICKKLNQTNFYNLNIKSEFFICQNYFTKTMIFDMIFNKNTYFNFYF